MGDLLVQIELAVVTHDIFLALPVADVFPFFDVVVFLVHIDHVPIALHSIPSDTVAIWGTGVVAVA